MRKFRRIVNRPGFEEYPEWQKGYEFTGVAWNRNTGQDKNLVEEDIRVQESPNFRIHSGSSVEEVK